MRTRALIPWLAAIGIGCATRPRDALRPIPDHPSAAADSLRGTARAAEALGDAEQIAIVRAVVRAFFRPTGGQARWLDPQPLAHARAADSASVPDDEWALAIVQAVGLRRVCILDEPDDECRGRPGGVVRFSRAYASGPASAIVYARYDEMPRARPAAERTRMELEFQMVRDRGAWRIESKRTITTP